MRRPTHSSWWWSEENSVMGNAVSLVSPSYSKQKMLDSGLGLPYPCPLGKDQGVIVPISSDHHTLVR